MNTKRMAMALSLCCSAVVLVACGSSSSNVASATNDLPTPGETTTEPTAPGFSWSSTPRNQSVTVSGIGQTVGVQIMNLGSSNRAITVSTASSGSASYTATYGGDDQATSAVVKAGGETIKLPFTEQKVTVIDGKNFSIDEFESRNNRAGVAIANPYSAGWDYQTFGFWNSSANSSRKLFAGPISVGRTTDGAAIPTTGAATYTGFAFGKSVVNGSTFDVVSEMRAQIDFANRRIAFSTINTLVEPDTDGDRIFSSNTSLNMTGTLIHAAANSNMISGTVTTAGGLSGTFDARFYGPGAEEIGGTFALGSGNNAYSGGFGGKR